METIKLDLIPGKKMPSLHASQYDDGRDYHIDLTENRVPYTLDGTETISLTVRKCDNTLVTMDVANVFGGKSYIEFRTTEQMNACAGFNYGEIVLEENGTRIGSLNFYLQVEGAPDEGGVSQSEINNLARQVEELVDEEMGDYLLKTEAEETYATITAFETLSGVVDTKASASDLETLAGVVDTKASKTYVDSVADTKADKATTYTKTEVDTLIDNLPEPMIFKGTLGVGGTIQSLPTASADNEGFTYKVITDGTYAGQTAKVGDVFISNGSDWVLVPAGDEDNDTWRAIKVNGTEVLGNGISSGSVDIVEGDNIKVTFDGNGNKVEIEADTIDDTQALTTKSWSSKKTYDEIVNVLPTGNASGSIANFNTSLALPMEIVADVNASGGGGTPSTPIPIVGVSSVTVTVADENMQAQETETINLGGTYYGCKVEVDKDGHRDLVLIWEKKKFSDIPNWYKGNLNTAQTGRQWYADFNSNPTYNSDDNSLCDSLTPSASNWVALNLNEYHSSNRYFVMVVDDTYADKTAMLSALGNYEFTLKLKTPVTIPLADGEPINALVGTNNVYADSGDIEVTYKKSIDDAIAELQALILS